MERIQSRVAKLARIHEVAKDTYVYTLELDAPLPFLAGQFVNLHVPGAPPKEERSYSVYSSPDDPSVMHLCIKLFAGGAASEFLRVAQPGQQLRIRGPFGVFTLVEGNDPVVFVCTATGIAPFRSMLLQRARIGDDRPYRMYFGVRNQGDLFALDDLADLERRLGDFAYRVCLSRPDPGWDGYVGRVTNAIADDYPHPKDHFYICGNGPMIDETKDLLKARGLERKRLHFEKYY